MRKVISIICFLIFLAGLPGLFSALGSSSNFAYILGVALIPALCLYGAIRFWKQSPRKQTDSNGRSLSTSNQEENKP